MILTLELTDFDNQTQIEAAICFDEEGLEFFIEKLVRLRKKKDHTHLMTKSWSGNELTEIKQGGDDYILVNHLRLVKT